MYHQHVGIFLTSLDLLIIQYIHIKLGHGKKMKLRISSYFHSAFESLFRLGEVNVNDFALQGLEIGEKATVKIRRNPHLRFLSIIHKII